MSEALTEEAHGDSTPVNVNITATTPNTVISTLVVSPDYYKIGLEHKATNNLSGALRAFESEISKNPTNAQAWLEIGRAHALLGLYSDASADLLRVTHLESTNHEAYYFLGCVYNLSGRYTKAAEALRTAIKMISGATIANYHFKLGYACQMDEQYREAINSYTKYIYDVSSEKPYLALLNRGICYYSINQYEKALTDFDCAVSMNSRENKAYLLCCRGRAKAKLGDKDGAVQDFKEAKRSSSPLLSFEMGVINNELHQHRDAIDNYTRAIEQTKHTADSYFRRGLSHAMLGDFNNALADYTRAIEETPQNNHSRAHFRRGLACVELKKLNDALNDYTRAIHFAKHHKDVYLMRAKLYLHLGRVEEATTDLREAAFWEKEELLDDDTPTETELEKHPSPTELPADIILPDSPFGILNNGMKQEEVNNYYGAMESYNQLLGFDPELFQKQLEELAKSKNSLTFDIIQAAAVKTTLEKHTDAMKKFEGNMNMKTFYASIWSQLEELFIGCKTVASGKVNPAEGRLGVHGERMELAGIFVALIPQVGDYISTVLQTSAVLVKKIDSARQKNIMTTIARSGMLLQLWEVSQSVAQTLTERYQPLLEQLRLPEKEQKKDNEDNIQKVAETHWWQFSHKRKELTDEDEASAQVPSVEIVESRCCLCYTKTKQRLLKEEEKTEAKYIGEYAVVLMLAALQDGKLKAHSSVQAMERELLQTVCIPLDEENKNTKRFFGKRRISIKTIREGALDGFYRKPGIRVWTLDGFYRKPGIRIEDGKEYANENMDTALYGFRLGTKEEVDQLEEMRKSKSGSSS